MSIAYLGLGSNLEDRRQNIDMAILEIEALGIIIISKASVIETDPVGGPPQGKFLNTVIKVHTTLPPLKLLQKLKAIEKDMGRVKTVKNGPRIIDIDILLYEDREIDTENLVIPHPRMFQRDFVMKPLKEINPEIMKKKLKYTAQ